MDEVAAEVAARTSAAHTLGAMLTTDAAALSGMRATDAPLRLLDALGGAASRKCLPPGLTTAPHLPLWTT